MNSATSAPFRWWKLLLWSATGAMIWPLAIAFGSRYPPDPANFDAAIYRHIWMQIILGGAMMGAVGYGIVRLIANRRAGCRPKSAKQ